jgi:flagellin
MVIGTNIAAQQSARLLEQSSANLSQSLARLSSGSKIVSPEDDAAGLAVVTRMDAKIHRLNAAGTCVSNAISYAQTQSGYLQQVSRAVDRMSELALLALDVTKTDSDRGLYNTEFQTLMAYVSNISNKQFNGISLFQANWSGSPNLTLSVPTDGEGGSFVMQLDFLGDTALSTIIDGGFSLTSAANADNARNQLKYSGALAARIRGQAGANLTRLEYTKEQLGVLQDNLTAASSRIQDVDVADESTRYARSQILVQAGTAMLAQANASPESVLRLLA